MSGFFYRWQMKMKKKAILLIVSLTGIVVLLLFLRQGPEKQDQPTEPSTVQGPPPAGLSKQEMKRNVVPSSPTGGKTLPVKPVASKRPERQKDGKAVAANAVTPVPDPATALKQWEDRLVLYYAEGAKERVKETPVTVDEQVEMRELFSALAPEAKLENINHAVNLLPDETFSVINGILFDTTQSPEIIAVIFHDLLNRDEAIKNPVMEEIVKNKAHPMYVESARILDIVKPRE